MTWERSPRNPIISIDSFPATKLGRLRGKNICNPCLLPVPDWLRPRLPEPMREATFLCWFGHHHGEDIRLAFTTDRDLFEAQWTLYEPGTLTLAQVIASAKVLQYPPGTWNQEIGFPDIHFDDARERVVMAFKVALRVWPRKGNHTSVAVSNDGVSFSPLLGMEYTPIADVGYLRAWDRRAPGGRLRAIGSFGAVYESADPENPWGSLERVEVGGQCCLFHPRQEELAEINCTGRPGPLGFGRHVGIQQYSDSDRVTVWFTKIGSAPESVLKFDIDGWGDDPSTATLSAAEECFRPEFPYEGSDIFEPDGTIKKSASGSASAAPLHQLRDPYWLRVGRREFVAYAGQGEHTICLARRTG